MLSRSLKSLARDWYEIYKTSPVLVETFVDPEKFSGSSYRAANWEKIGETAGRADGFANGKKSSGKKDIYVYPLNPNYKEVLCQEPARQPLSAFFKPSNPGSWMEEEFGGVEIFDERLARRLYLLAEDFYSQPGALIPQVCGGVEAKSKAAYRFFNNKLVNMEVILRPHVAATIDRIKEHQVVLAVQDTTSLNYTAHAAEGMGPINNTSRDKAVGILLHNTMAFSEEGLPLGLLNVQCIIRDAENRQKSKERHQRPIEEKESNKWLIGYEAAAEAHKASPATQVIVVGDREADIYELFHKAAKDENGPKLLIRAERTRNRKVENQYLWDRIKQQEVAGYQEIYVPGKGSRPARTARMEVKYLNFELKPPKDKQKLEAIKICAVYTKEVNNAPEIKEPLEWMLLTTVATNSFEDACARISQYAKRWGIEVYHRTLKSGCRIEDRRLCAEKNLEACLAIDFVIAWRIYWLTILGRETPEIPCDVFLSEDEWKVLCACASKKKIPAGTMPTLREAVRMIAALGGFLGRKGDGEPGTTTIWRGLQRLADITLGYRLLLNANDNCGGRGGPQFFDGLTYG